MKINKIMYLIIVSFITLFSFNLNVDAAQELTCVYENDYKLTQDTAGVVKLYELNDDNGIKRWNEITKLFDKKIEFKFNSSLYTDSLSDCTEYLYFESNVVNVSDKKSSSYYSYSLESRADEVETVEEHSYQELTCLYEKQGSKNDRDDIWKVLLTQDSDGNIKVYKNKEDVGLIDYSSYWIYSPNNDYYFDDASLNIDSVTGGLLSCPTSKTTGRWYDTTNGTGDVRFFGNDMGEDNLVKQEFKIVNFLTESVNYGSAPSIDVGVGQVCNNISNNQKWLTEFDESQYAGSCLYQADTEWGCHIIEFNISSDYSRIVDSFVGKRFNYYNYYSYITDYQNFSPQHIKNTAESIGCPPVLNVDISTHISYDERMADGKISYGGKGEKYSMIAVRGYNAFTGEKLTLDGELLLQFEEINIFDDCADLFNGNENVIDLLSSVITIFKIAIPLILFGLGAMDFVQAIFSGNEDGMKKAQAKFIKRILIAVCIFLIPSVLKLILTIANGIWGDISTDLCGLL